MRGRRKRRRHIIRVLAFSVVLFCSQGTICHAQYPEIRLTGYVIDGATGDSIPFASVQYEGHNIAVMSNIDGLYDIERRPGWTITFSAVGYKQRKMKVTSSSRRVNVTLERENRVLGSVTVEKKRGRYSRKNNPAVDLMRRVIEEKKKTRLENNDYYRYDKYQKLTLALNDVKPSDLENPKLKKQKWLINQVEPCPYNGKLILPVSVSESVTQHLYRKSPRSEKVIVIGQNETGVNDVLQTGDIVTNMVRDVFTDVNIYDDQIRLLQYPFTSPIGKGAIEFYRFYIVDTVAIERDSCVHLHFLPNNQQDFGFRGDIYILKDSSYQVRRCNLTLPKKSDVNFVENMRILQDFTKLPDGQWVLTTDDMIVEMSLAKFLQKGVVIRTTRLSGFAFDKLPAKLFRGRKRDVFDANAKMQNDDFWQRYRQVELTKSESSMDKFLEEMQKVKVMKYVIFGLKALIENFVETGTKDHPSKVDIGPINTMLTSNFIDGPRSRISLQTTGNMHKQLFLKGYVAHGWGSGRNYYLGEAVWSFNKKEYLPREFPKRTLTFSATSDICSPSDKFVNTDKDNVFTSFKWSTVDKMMFYNRQELSFEWEEEWGMKMTAAIKAEKNSPAGEMFFLPLSRLVTSPYTYFTKYRSALTGNPLTLSSIRTTEVRASLRYAPGETFINTKQRRIPVNLNSPVFYISHTAGFKGLLGGDYNYNYTDLHIYKRFWVNSWGKIDCHLKAGCEWNTVPYPLLIMPAANLSYIIEDETFNLVNNMEFLNDRFMSLDISWDMNGKIFNRVPLLHKLKWREYIGFKMLWGTLTDKNNPFLERNRTSDILMQFPEGCHVMDESRPYMELILGVHNIFKLLHVEYVRRINYHELPTAERNAVRLMMRFKF